MSKQYIVMNKKTGKFLLNGCFDEEYTKFGSLQHRSLLVMTKGDCKMEIKYATVLKARYAKHLVIKEIKMVVVK